MGATYRRLKSTFWCRAIAPCLCSALDLSQVAYASSSKSPPAPNVLGNPVTATINLILSLVVIIVLIVLLVRFLAQKSQVQQRGSIQVLAAKQLAPNRSVQVIELGTRKYLLGVGDEVTLLGDVTDELALDEADGQDATHLQFHELLGESLRTIRRRYSANPGQEDDS